MAVRVFSTIGSDLLATIVFLWPVHRSIRWFLWNVNRKEVSLYTSVTRRIPRNRQPSSNCQLAALPLGPASPANRNQLDQRERIRPAGVPPELTGITVSMAVLVTPP